jgi:hypothetical protein
MGLQLKLDSTSVLFWGTSFKDNHNHVKHMLLINQEKTVYISFFRNYNFASKI